MAESAVSLRKDDLLEARKGVRRWKQGLCLLVVGKSNTTSAAIGVEEDSDVLFRDEDVVILEEVGDFVHGESVVRVSVNTLESGV